MHFARADVEVDSTQGMDAGEALRDAADFE